jgi:hypothetical protein
VKFNVVSFARILALLWAGFWAFFFVAESWAWNTPIAVALPWAGVGLLFLLLALLPWRWQFAGGILLAIAGLLTGAAYALLGPPQLPLASRLLTVGALALPPLAAGILLLVDQRAP